MSLADISLQKVTTADNTCHKKRKSIDTGHDREHKRPRLTDHTKECNSSRNTISTNTLRPLLKCTLCSELYLKPHSLKCSHTFCQHCINKHLKKKKVRSMSLMFINCQECPLCHAIVLRKPYYNRLVDNMVEKFEEYLQGEEKEKRTKYKQELTAAQMKAIAKFKEAAAKLIQNGTKMLNILDEWEIREKEVFRVGYDKYDGEYRIAYCELVGFTKEIVETATDEMIAMMLNNLGVEVPRYISVVPVKYDYEMGRAILMDILFG
jgi:hypothetical protein